MTPWGPLAERQRTIASSICARKMRRPSSLRCWTLRCGTTTTPAFSLGWGTIYLRLKQTEPGSKAARLSPCEASRGGEGWDAGTIRRNAVLVPGGVQIQVDLGGRFFNELDACYSPSAQYGPAEVRVGLRQPFP